MKYIVNGIEKEITLKAWNGSSYDPDIFADLETGHAWGEEMSEETYNEIVEYWRDEVEAYNRGSNTEQFGQREFDSSVEEFGFWAD